MREAADHLEDAVEALVEAGEDQDVAARRAVGDFGSIAEVAASFQSTLAVAAARRTALLLVVVLGYQPMLWDSGFNLASGTRGARSDSWFFELLDRMIEAGSLLILVGALLVLAATGLGNRWWLLGLGSAKLAAVFSLAAALFVGLASVAMVATAGGDNTGVWLLALTLVVLPLGGVVLSACGTLAASWTRQVSWV